MSRILIIIILVCANFFLIGSLVTAQQKISTNSKKSPIEITAENGIEWHKNEKKYIASGNAIAKQGDLIVTSDRLEAYYKDSDKNEENIDVIKAIGNVRIKNKNAFIEGGENASYFLGKEYFIINGENIKLKSKENKLFADKKIEFWRLENIAVATGNAIAKKKMNTLLRLTDLPGTLK